MANLGSALDYITLGIDKQALNTRHILIVQSVTLAALLQLYWSSTFSIQHNMPGLLTHCHYP